MAWHGTDWQSLAGFDRVVATWLREMTPEGGDVVFEALSRLGSTPVLLALAGVALLGIWRRRDGQFLVAPLAATVVGGMVLMRGLKAVFGRPRPLLELPLEQLATWSFPSGHAMNSLVTFGVLGYAAFLVVRRPVARAGILALAAALVVGVGASRVYLGAHYASDVLAGWIAGALWLALLLRVLSSAARARRKRRP